MWEQTHTKQPQEHEIHWFSRKQNIITEVEIW